MLVGTEIPDVVGIVGSRGPDPERGRLTGWEDAALVSRIIRRLLERRPDVTIISGGAPSGVDWMVRSVCQLLRFCDGKHIEIDPRTVDCTRPHFYEFKAAWHGPDGKGPLNRQAGFTRNDKLVRHCLLVIALFAPGPMTPGTRDVVNRCHEYEIPCLVYHEGVWS